ncbi:hypothetical protein TSAR_007253 [Trichomalopsis sarcophagae]|uniref:CNH domain-containing protein n=1 Tax=Trichomalopsis sarcophagae TaxID=543379 RepID=A0A232EG37_9HYME|nr:hypothetical protein TSAR_007253 [Trichomalopsis sarcophagae]
MSRRLLFDRSVQIKQLDVVEQHGILIFRAGDKGKDCNVHVFRLSELESQDDEQQQQQQDEDEEEEQEVVACAGLQRRRMSARTRAHAKQRKLERTKGCHLYSLTRPGGSHLRMCVAVGRRLSVLQWKHTAAWTTWRAEADTDTVDGFKLMGEFQVSETPSIMTIIESQEPGREWMICCGLRHHYELIYPDTAPRSLHLEVSVKPHLVAALDLCEDEEPELLLCYNSQYILHFISTKGEYR